MIGLEASRKYHGRYFHVFWALQALARVKGRVLDVGCGPGVITSTIKKARPDLEFYACDNDPYFLTVFRKNYPQTEIKISQDNAYKLSFEGGCFDAVLMTDVLEHLKEPAKAIEEAVRVLKRGGVFYLSVPLEAELISYDGWLRLIGINLKKKPVGHIQQFRLSEAQDLVTGAGLKITATHFSHHLIYQFFSFWYFVYTALIRRGKYWNPNPSKKAGQTLFLWLKTLTGWLVYLESRLLGNIRGQTVHIMAKK